MTITDDIQCAADVLFDAFEDLAPSEALTRALVAERTEAAYDANFWIDVYRICKTRMTAIRPDNASHTSAGETLA